MNGISEGYLKFNSVPMKTFLDENFLLHSATAEKLYHEYSKDLPIIDYHCHLSPEDIYRNRQFHNITEAWLEGDHYKWRAMRANGIDERYCTGDAPPREKFRKWAETVPMTLRNPLYQWTHLELRRYFGIKELLSEKTAGAIYEHTTEMLNSTDFSVRNLLLRMKVEVVCTTDDPADSLEWHKKLRDEKFIIKVLPTWRADRILTIENPADLRTYLERLGQSSGIEIKNLGNLKEALEKRHDYFASLGCRLSDHGLERFYAEDYTESEIEGIFDKALQGKEVDMAAAEKYKSAMLCYLAELDQKKGWTQQFHIGALRNANSRMFRKLGPDKGYDSIADHNLATGMAKFFDRLDRNEKLSKTILYNLNPADNELFATMAGNYNDGITAGKMQFGSGWWFLDQKDGMERQMNALSNMGLLSLFVGMLTDSRSFLSYPRHEYFRRILCNLVGKDAENGELPIDYDLLGRLVRDVSYFNAKRYFGF
jgi:glucuronate isomerase